MVLWRVEAERRSLCLVEGSAYAGKESACGARTEKLWAWGLPFSDRRLLPCACGRLCPVLRERLQRACFRTLCFDL